MQCCSRWSSAAHQPRITSIHDSPACPFYPSLPQPTPTHSPIFTVAGHPKGQEYSRCPLLEPICLAARHTPSAPAPIRSTPLATFPPDSSDPPRRCNIRASRHVAAMSKIARSVKNVTKGYSQVEVKVRNGREYPASYTYGASDNCSHEQRSMGPCRLRHGRDCPNHFQQVKCLVSLYEPC